MTISETEALDAIRTHHQMLEGKLRARVAVLAAAAAGDRPYELAAGALVAYLGGEVLPHAAAEEQTIYPAAAAQPGLAGTVTEMTAEHRALAMAAERLASAASGAAAAVQAEKIAALFAAHVVKENDLLLPVLRDATGTDLAVLLAEMQHQTGETARGATGTGAPAGADPQAMVLSLLLEAATALARAGQGDRACQLAASAWAALRGTRPDLAVKVTAALHGLARRVAGETGAPGEPGDNEPASDPARSADGPELDVRDLPPAQRHETIFTAYGALAPGAGFVLVNDHDPKPLRYQFEAEHAGDFTWHSIQAGPETWRVRIGRPPAGDSGERRPEPGGGAGPDLDVRVLQHWERHDTIFTAYGALAPGAGFVLVNDHDPKPLRYQFEAQHPGEFTWDYLKAGPEVWRVRIGRPGN